jgi:hypothetical protein
MLQNIEKNKGQGWRGWNKDKRLFQIIELVEPVTLTNGNVLKFRASNGEPNGFIWASSLEDLDRSLSEHRSYPENRTFPI